MTTLSFLLYTSMSNSSRLHPILYTSSGRLTYRFFLGEPVNHAFAKELIAGIAGAEVDKLFETKGLDFLDREKAKRHAKEQAEQMYDHQYGDMDQYDP